MDSIYDIIHRLDAIAEDIGPDQRSVKQLPALFKPPQTSPQLSGPYPGKNATRGYLVGEAEDVDDDDADQDEKEEQLDEAATTEDVLSTMKKKLGDYLQDVATAIRKDPDLLDKVDQAVDQIGPAVKTIRTDDGHEIKIHGNEDDGFRVSIKNQTGKSNFKSLDEATMACEMYCAHRRNRAMSADYIEEKKIS